MWIWLGLMVFLAIPLPLHTPPPVERGVPIVYLLLAGAVAIYGRVARISLPLALVLTYALGRTVMSLLWGDVDLRAANLLILLTMVAVLFPEAFALSRRWTRRCAWALLFGIAVEGLLGVLNLWGIYLTPFILMKPLFWLGVPYPVIHAFMGTPHPVMLPGFQGKAMGWLTHQNYWGSYIALGVAPAYWLLGAFGGVALLTLTLGSMSLGPIASASVAFGVMLAQDQRFSRRVKAWAFSAVGVIVVCMAVVRTWLTHNPVDLEHWTSGRSAVWALAWPTFTQSWISVIFGIGLGFWRQWADTVNQVTHRNLATLQAHDEFYQLIFELGLVVVPFVVWALWQIARRLPVVLRGPEAAWAALLLGVLVNSLVSPMAHLPAQAGITVFALARVYRGGAH